MTPEAQAGSAVARRQGLRQQAVPQPTRCCCASGTLLETRFLYLQIQSQNQILEAKVRERTRELEAAQIEIIERLARAAEFRDDNTGQHTERVGQMAALLARQIGLPDPQVSLIRRAAPLHDVGKIGIPDSILLKLGKLTPEEFELVKTHTTIGARILSGSRFALLRLAEEIAFSHHERWDGDGYAGISGDADSARRPHRRRRRRVRRADAEAALQGGVAGRRGDRRNRAAARPAVRSRRSSTRSCAMHRAAASRRRPPPNRRRDGFGRPCTTRATRHRRVAAAARDARRARADWSSA